jgi:hypothetical protein
VRAHRQRIVARREALEARSRRLRGELAADAGALGVRFEVADRLVGLARSDQGRLWLAGAALLVLVWRPRRVLRVGLRVLSLWPVASLLLPHVRRYFTERGEASA